MVDPTPFETLSALVGLLAFLFVLIACIVGLSVRALRLARRFQTPNSNATIDARILVAENIHVHGDPTAPTAEYGATRNAHQSLLRRR